MSHDLHTDDESNSHHSIAYARNNVRQKQINNLVFGRLQLGIDPSISSGNNASNIKNSLYVQFNYEELTSCQ
jgi:hypothetical protein